MCKQPQEHIPRSPLGLPEEFRSWPVFDEGARLENIFEGAWVLRGDRLEPPVDDEDYPSGVLVRLRGGFFRERSIEVFTKIFRIEAQVKKAIASLEQNGGNMFGFDENREGIIESDIEGLESFLSFSAEVLLAFISQLIPSYKYFQDTISFLHNQSGEGKFRIVGPVPVGPWMHGAVTDTGWGLLYVGLSKKYFSYETINGVSGLFEYTETGMPEEPKTKLGEWIAFGV